jgi:CBS domain-containing protein
LGDLEKMFTVFDPNGITRPYALTPSPQSRAISSVHAASAITPKQSVNPEHRHTAPNPYQKLDQQPEPKRILYAKDLMTSPVMTLDHKATVKEAQKIFEERRYRHLPILNAESRIIGIISDRDLLKRIANAGKEIEKGAISLVMKTDVLTASPEADIRTIAQVMFEAHIGSLPIIDQQFSLVGIITRSDILRGLLKHGPIELWG